MHSDSDLLVVYGHENIFINTGQGSDQLAYYIHFLLSASHGLVDDVHFRQFMFDELFTMEQKNIFAKTKLIGPFSILGELEDFCLKVSSYFKQPSIMLLTVNEYNDLVLDLNSADELIPTLFRNANSLQPVEGDTKKGFFSSLFKS